MSGGRFALAARVHRSPAHPTSFAVLTCKGLGHKLAVKGCKPRLAWCRMDDLDTDRIDEAVLALLYLGLHEDRRAWKSFDWDALDRLHDKGLISNPASKAKSVVFSEDGLRRAEALFDSMFRKAS